MRLKPMHLRLLTRGAAGCRQELVYVPGRIVNRMTSALGEFKTDAKDARVIAEIARIQAGCGQCGPGTMS